MINLMTDIIEKWIVIPVLCICALDALYIYILIKSKKTVGNMIFENKHFQIICIILFTIIVIIVLSILNVAVMMNLYEKTLVSLNSV